MFTAFALICAIFVALQLLPAGLSKFEDGKSKAIFDSLGGDRVRYMVGAAELIAPLLLLWSTTAPFGLAMIFPIMIGAIYLHMFVWKNSPKNAAMVLIFATLSVIFRAV